MSINKKSLYFKLLVHTFIYIYRTGLLATTLSLLAMKPRNQYELTQTFEQLIRKGKRREAGAWPNNGRNNDRKKLINYFKENNNKIILSVHN